MGALQEIKKYRNDMRWRAVTLLLGIVFVERFMSKFHIDVPYIVWTLRTLIVVFPLVHLYVEWDMRKQMRWFEKHFK